MADDVNGRPLYDLVVDYVSSLDAQRKRRLVTFLEVQDQTIRSWVRGSSVPSGLRALRMHYLLDRIGRRNTEWRPTHQAVIDVGKLLAFKAISMNDIESAFSHVIDDRLITLMLCGHAHIKPAYLSVFQNIADNNIDGLERAVNDWSDLLVGNERERVLAEVASKLADVLPLCEAIASDEWTAEERHDLRRRCGSNTVFRLYNALGALCGERARQHTLKHNASFITG